MFPVKTAPGAVEALAGAGTTESTAIPLGEADAVAGVACACQQCPPRAPKTHAPHAHQKLIVFSFVQVCASTVDVKHATEAIAERARETELCCFMPEGNTSYLLQTELFLDVYSAHVRTRSLSVRHQTRFGEPLIGELIFFAYATPIVFAWEKSSGVGKSRHAFSFRWCGVGARNL